MHDLQFELSCVVNDGLCSPVDVAISRDGGVYVADTGILNWICYSQRSMQGCSGNHCIRQVLPAGQLVTVAGDVGNFGHSDSTCSGSKFDSPVRVECASAQQGESLYVVDAYNTCLRCVSEGRVETIPLAEIPQHGSGLQQNIETTPSRSKSPKDRRSLSSPISKRGSPLTPSNSRTPSRKHSIVQVCTAGAPDVLW